MAEDTRVGGTTIENEVPPNQGINIRPMDAKDLKDGDVVNLLQKGANRFGAVEESFKVKRAADGTITLTPVEKDLPWVREKTRELAKQIVATRHDEIMAQAEKAIEEALSRKPIEKLERMKAGATEGKPAKVSTKKGCMFLSIGDEETVL